MPIYVYKCQKCGKTQEVLQRFSDPPLTTCPDCQGKLEKQFSGQVGLQFNGSGFYITDYVRNNGKSQSATADKGEQKSESKTK